jgi:hypothetical protein
MPTDRDAVPSAGSRRRLRPVPVVLAIMTSAVLSAVLPGAVAAADESSVATVTGRLVQAWSETHPDAVAAGHTDDGPISWIRTAAGEDVPIATEDVAGVQVGSTMSVTVAADGGDEDDRSEVLRSEVLAPAEVPAPAELLASAVGARITNQVTIAMVGPGGTKSDGTSLDSVVDAVNGPVATFWSEQSDGAITIGVTDRHDWLSTPVDCSQPGLLWDDVAERVHFEPGPGKHLVVYVSRASGCAYGMGEIGLAPTTGGRLYVQDPVPSLIAHELGHNFGLGHSSALQCEAATETGSCRTAGYRDYYDVMGASWRQLGSLNAPQAADLGVLPATARRDLSVWGGSAAVTLAPLAGRTGTRALRLTDASGVDYWLEYRAGTGRDAWLTRNKGSHGLETGVLLRRAGAFPDTSLLLDPTPSAAGAWDADFRSALPVGVSVRVADGQFTVVVDAVDAGGATVRIVPAPSPPPVAPDAVPARAADPGRSGTVLPGAGAGAAPASAAPAPVAGQAPVVVAADAREALLGPRSPAIESAGDTARLGGIVGPAVGVLVLGGTVVLLQRLRSAARRR